MTTTATSPATIKKYDLKTFNQTLSSQGWQNHLNAVLGEKRNAFVNNITALVANNKQLQECDPQTIIYAGIKATALDLPLDPNLGLAYVIAYRNKGMAEAQFQIGYKGFVQLAIRSGQFKTINVTDVREGELGEYDLLTGETNIKALPNREKLKVVGYAAYFRLINGFEKTIYFTREDIEAHGRKYSKAYGYLWTSDFDSMAKKTVLKLLLSKYAPLSIDMQTAVTSDQAIITENGYHYAEADNADATEVKDDQQPKTLSDLANEAVEENKSTAERAQEIIDKHHKEKVNQETGEIQNG